MKIRLIEKQDYEQVYEIYKSELYMRLDHEEFRKNLSLMENDKTYATFVAEDSGKVVGFITVVRVLSMTGTYLKINGLAVEKSRQGSGFGSALLEGAKQYARENAISHIILCTGFQRVEAHKFYENRGFDKKSYCMTVTV